MKTLPLCQIPAHKTHSRKSWATLAMFAACLPLVIPMTGCYSLFISKRKLLVPIAPATVQTASADELVAQLNQQWSKFESLTASVDIRASRLKTQEGTATDYPSFRANLLLRRPGMLRILGRVPVLQTTMFDLASDGSRFTLIVPHFDTAYQGLNSNQGTSKNWYENLRPGFLFDAMVVRGLNPGEQYSVIAEDITEEDTASKRLFLHPEYELSVVRAKPGSQELFPIRVVHFHREDLLPYEQDLYDDKGNLQTQIIYGSYNDFDGYKYPATITLKRPQDQYQLVMSVERVASNPKLTDDQFQIPIPKDYKVQNLK